MERQVVTCKACEIGLPDGTSRCPMCQRNLRVPVALIIGSAVGLVLIMVLLLAGSTRLKSRVQNWQLSPDVVLKATETLVARSPALHSPVTFSALDQSSVEHWDAYRWRVSGFVDNRSDGGVKVRTLYFAVVQTSGNEWKLEDLQLQNIDSGGATRKK